MTFYVEKEKFLLNKMLLLLLLYILKYLKIQILLMTPSTSSSLKIFAVCQSSFRFVIFADRVYQPSFDIIKYIKR